MEEMYHLTKDPQEMTNLANSPEAGPLLQTMHKHYDAELEKWKQEAVSYNNYQQYGTLFDRSIPLEQKKSARKKK